MHNTDEPRYSTRSRSKRAPPTTISTSEAQSKAAEGSTNRQSASRKKQRTSPSTEAKGESVNASKAPAKWAKVKGRRGHLKMVVEMPLDVLLEVLSYLRPVDLLNLSRVSRAMRGIILDRGLALPLWTAVSTAALI